jgi:imidazoleglycerol phosphate synthase glutamine amidotransferase subunit HisH
MKKHFRQLGHSYDCTKPIAWPSIVLADPAKYGALMVAIAARKLHATNKFHPERLCPVCRQRSEVAA